MLVTGDCLQNWGTTDKYFSWPAKLMMKRLGFIVPHNVGPAWFKQGKPPKDQMRGLMELSYANVLPSHGTPVLGHASGHYRAAIERVTA